jgi:hypothetical protein
MYTFFKHELAITHHYSSRLLSNINNSASSSAAVSSESLIVAYAFFYPTRFDASRNALSIQSAGRKVQHAGVYIDINKEMEK